MIAGARVVRQAATTTKAQLQAEMVYYSQMQTGVTELLQAWQSSFSTEVDDLTTKLHALMQSYSETMTTLSNVLQTQYDALQDVISHLPSSA